MSTQVDPANDTLPIVDASAAASLSANKRIPVSELMRRAPVQLSDLAAEASARAAGDIYLQTQIGAIVGGSAVTTDGSIASRAAFVLLVESGILEYIIDGVSVIASGLVYIRQVGATAIQDLPGWVPAEAHTALHFGAVGDGVTDDATAIQRYATWCAQAGAPRDIDLPSGYLYRISSPVVVDYHGSRCGKIRIRGPIVPDAGIGRALSIINGRGGEFDLWVQNGGQTADYSQADPVGCDEAFLIRGIRGATIRVFGQNYKGRVLRVTEALSSEYKTSLLNIERLVTGDIAGSTSAICGQSIFADVNGTAFGKLGFMWANWDEYGPVFQDCIDLSFTSIEGGWRSNTGLEFRGCASVWGDKIAVGDESNVTPALVKFTNSATRRCWNISIDKVFIIGSVDGVQMENIGINTDDATLRTGIRIGTLFTRNCTGRGLYGSNCANVHIDLHDSENDGVPFEAAGVFRDSDVCMNYRRSKRQAVIVSLTSGRNLTLAGMVRDANTSGTAGIHAISIASLEAIWARGLIVAGSATVSLINLPSNNQFLMIGGSLTVGGSTVMFGGTHPKLADNVANYINRARSRVTIPAGASSVTVTHGLSATPEYAWLQERNSDANGQACRPQSFGASTFVIATKSGAAVSADSLVDYDIKMGNAP